MSCAKKKLSRTLRCIATVNGHQDPHLKLPWKGTMRQLGLNPDMKWLQEYLNKMGDKWIIRLKKGLALNCILVCKAPLNGLKLKIQAFPEEENM